MDFFQSFIDKIYDSFYKNNIRIEQDGWNIKLKLDIDGKEKSLGQIFFDPNNKVLTYVKYDSSKSDVFFLPYSIIKHLSLDDQIQINEHLKKDTILRYSFSVLKLCQNADFVNLQDYGLQILAKKENLKSEKMRFSISENRFVKVKE